MNNPNDVPNMNLEERQLRRMLCATYAGSKAYMDDGEASDSSVQPFIDFLRMPVSRIRELMQERGLKQYEEFRKTNIVAEELARANNDEIWVRKNGVKVPIGEMHPDHAKNALRMIMRKARQQKEMPQWLKEAYEEAQDDQSRD